jgi:hypothetical protein
LPVKSLASGIRQYILFILCSTFFPRLAFNRNTDRPHGYGFCEFAGTYILPFNIVIVRVWLEVLHFPIHLSLNFGNLRMKIYWSSRSSIQLADWRWWPYHSDHETASSAVRTLDGHKMDGRALRCSLADSDPYLEGKTTVRGEIVPTSTTERWKQRRTDDRGPDG